MRLRWSAVMIGEKVRKGEKRGKEVLVPGSGSSGVLFSSGCCLLYMLCVCVPHTTWGCMEYAVA